MTDAKQNVDTARLFARYAETGNALGVAKEFGVSRYQVKHWWEKLPETERQKYKNEVIEAREKAIAEATQATRNKTIDTAEQIATLRASLLEKLTESIYALKTSDTLAIARIKDAATALKIIMDTEVVPQSANDIENYFTNLVKLQRNERPN